LTPLACLVVLLAGLSLCATTTALADSSSDWALLDGPLTDVAHFWPSANGTIFAANASHQWFRTDDAGTTWQTVTPPPGGFLAAADPTDPAILYGVSGDELLKTIDGGTSWTPIYRGTHTITNVPWQHIAVSPADHNVLYLAGPLGEAGQWTLGPEKLPLCCTARFVATSQDGGQTWQTVAELSPSSFCQDWVTLLVPHPTEARRLFRNQGCYAGRDIGERLQDSLDGGSTWSTLFRSGQQQDPRLLVGGRGANPRRFYLTTSHYLGLGPARVYRSDDDGATWTAILAPTDPRSVVFGGLAYDADNPDDVFVATGITPSADDTGVRVSHDGGATWDVLGRPDLGWVNDLVRLPDGTMLAATNEGVWRYVP
jgi:hypothetical protein